MKIIAKVIDDNGFRIELIRPLRDIALSVGTTVEITLAPKQTNLINVFNNIIDDDTRDLILDKINSERTSSQNIQKQKVLSK